MRLPQSRQNVYPGLYLTIIEPSVYMLLAIKSENSFLQRKSGKWVPYADTNEYWANPNGISILQSHEKELIELFDAHQEKGTQPSLDEIQKFTLFY